MKKNFDPQAPYQAASFDFQDASAVDEIIGRYPAGRQMSAIMPLLDLAQRQVAETGPFGDLPTGGGWIPRAAMDEIARIVDVPPIRVYEVATFYSMYNIEPVGKYLVQLCTTTPCWLCGSAGVVDACEKNLGVHVGETTKDGMFTLMEVECLGACANAPMVQVNDLYYEDLTPDSMNDLLNSLKKGVMPPAGPQNNRQKAAPVTGPTTLKAVGK